MIFLRCLRSPDGRPLLTHEEIARQLGYTDRRNVHNFWMEFEACGQDLEAFLRRRKKVDGEVVGPGVRRGTGERIRCGVRLRFTPSLSGGFQRRGRR